MKSGLFFLFGLIMICGQALAQADSVLWKEAKAYYANDQYREALNLMDKYIKRDSLNPEAYKIRGNCYHELNQTEKAMKDYQRAFTIDPLYAHAYYNMGNLLEEQEDLDSAEYYFRKYIHITPTDPDGLMRLGLNLQLQDRTDSVLALFEQAYALDTTVTPTLIFLIQEYYYNSDYQNAALYAQKGERQDSLDINFYIIHGLSALKLGAFEEAKAVSQKALQIDSLNFDAFLFGLKASILTKTRPDQLIKNEYQEFQLKYISQSNFDTLSISDDFYSSRMDRVRKGELLTLDEYFKLYISQSKQPGYSPYGQHDHPEIGKFFEEENYTAIIPHAAELFQANPLSLSDLYEVAAAGYITRNMDVFRTYYSLYFGILESILASGSGLSFDSAYVVVSTSDEYALLYYLGLVSDMQSLHFDGGHNYDILTARNDLDETHEVHFNIDMPFGSLNAALSGGKSSKKKKKK